MGNTYQPLVKSSLSVSRTDWMSGETNDTKEKINITYSGHKGFGVTLICMREEPWLQSSEDH